MISKAHPQESQLLSVLFRTVYINTYGSEGVSWEFSNFMDHQFSKNKIQETLNSSNSTLWVARLKQNPIGIIQVDLDKTCPTSNLKYPEINKLYILKQFFGQGIGQNLMLTAETELRKKGQNKVWLWLLESNQRALDFYLKQGYKNIGKANFQMEENNYRNIVLSKSL